MGCSSSFSRHTTKCQLYDYLTRRQVALVKDSWLLLTDDMDETGSVVFYRLFEMHPEYKKFFGDANDTAVYEDVLKRHSSVVMEALGAAVESLDDSQFLTSILQALGHAHVDHKITPVILQKMWPSIQYALKVKLGSELTEETELAWKFVFDYIVMKMSEGMEKDKKK